MIIIINGTSSSGKSSVALALQQRLGDGWLKFATDEYLGMLGEKFFGLHPNNPNVCIPNNVCYAKQNHDQNYEIIPGKLCSKLYATIPDTLEILAKQNFNIIVDSFITTQDDFLIYKEKLANHDVKFIYLYASHELIASREQSRGDRLLGSAINWLKNFDCQDNCDLKIDTGTKSAEEACDIIIQKFI